MSDISSAMFIPQNNPTLSLVEPFAKRQGYLFELCQSYPEALWRELLEKELLDSPSLGGRAILLPSVEIAFALALRLIGFGANDLAFCPIPSPLALVDLIYSLRGTLYFVDINPSTLSISAEGVKACSRDVADWRHRKKKVVVVEHFGGIEADTRVLKAFIDTEQLIPIELCQELSASTESICQHSLGGYQILSLGEYAEGISSAGVMLVCPTVERCERGRSLIRSLRLSAMRDPVIPLLYGDLRISSMQLVRAFIEREYIEEKGKRRQTIADFYRESISKILGISLFDSFRRSDYSFYPLRNILLVDNSLLNFTKEELIVRLQEKGIEAISFPMPLYMHPRYSRYKRYLNGLSSGWYDKALYLPGGSGLSMEGGHYVVDEILSIVRHFN